MSVSKQLKLAQKAVEQQRQAIEQLDSLAKSIERCENTIIELKTELEAVNTKHQVRKTTQDDIDYLTALLKCAHKKLGWEKQLASLRKRTPAILQTISTLANDPVSPPSDEMRTLMMSALQKVHSAMQQLDKVKME